MSLSRALAAPAAALGLLAAALPASAAPILLENGVAFLEIDPESPDGLTGWTVNGVPHVRTQSFWIGTAGGPEIPLSDLSLFLVQTDDADGDGVTDGLGLIYTRPDGPPVGIGYKLTGSAIGASGPLVSELRIDVRIFESEDGETIRLVQYTDVDLFNSYADDEALLSGTPLAAVVTDSSGLGRYESSWSLAPGAVEASVYDSLLASLLDGNPTTLTNALFASGDVTLGAAWDIEIPFFESLTFSQTQSIRIVPEPGTLLLLAAGLAGLVARRQEMTR